MKPFRFGVQVLAPPDGTEWVRLCRRAESAGCSVLTLPDHLIDGCISPFAALGVAAAVTSNLRLGPLVLNNELRHPSVVAREILALDFLSDGRIELGLGAGSPMSRPEHEAIGARFDDAAARVARLDESVAVLDGLLRGAPVDFTGKHYRFVAHRAWPPPMQQPRPPILLGGSGPVVLDVAARRADIVSLSGLGARRDRGGLETSGFAPEVVDDRVARIRETGAGRVIELHALVQRVIVTDDRRAAAEKVRENLPDLTVDEILATPYLWIGSPESIGDDLLAARERWGFSYFTVFQDALDALEAIMVHVDRSA